MWYSWLHSCPVEYSALLRSHSKRSIGHSGSICFLMKSTPSLIRLCRDVQVRLYRISFFGKWLRINVFFNCFFYVDSVTFNTSKDCRVGWDFEQLPAFCRQEFMVAGVKSGRSTADPPRLASWGKVLPLGGEGGLQSYRSPHVLSARPPLDATRPTARG